MNNKSDQKQIIIIKHIKKKHAPHHGGSWKIAYADFVTAMMAFFLLMWLLSLLNKYQLDGIAEYFKKPLKEIFTRQDNIRKNVDPSKPDHVGPAMDKQTGYNEMGSNQAYIGSNLNNDAAKSTKQEQKKKSVTPQNHVIDTIASNPQSGPITKTESPTAKPTTSSGGSSSTTTQQGTASSTQTQQSQELQKQKMQQMKEIQQNIIKDITKDPELSQYKNMLNFVVTADGLKINLHELEGKPMFSNGETDFQAYAAKLLGVIAKEVNKYPSQVEIIGHTDSLPYKTDQFYSNWELSADRASSVRRILIKNGMDKDKILRLIGEADALPLDHTDPYNPINRRIEIVILNDAAAARIKNEH